MNARRAHLQDCQWITQETVVVINCRFWTTSASGLCKSGTIHINKRLLTYCRPRYIFFAQDGHRKRGVPEAEVVQNRQFISTDRIIVGHVCHILSSTERCVPSNFAEPATVFFDGLDALTPEAGPKLYDYGYIP